MAVRMPCSKASGCGGSRDIDIDGDDLVDAAAGGVALPENTATDGAGSGSDDHPGCRVASSDCRSAISMFRVTGPGDEQHVGMAGRSNEVYAEPLDIVDRIVQCGDFNFTTVARPASTSRMWRDRPKSSRARALTLAPISSIDCRSDAASATISNEFPAA